MVVGFASDSEIKLSSSLSVHRNPSLHGLPLGPSAAERVVARAGGHEATDDDENAGEHADADHGERDCLVGRWSENTFRTENFISRFPLNALLYLPWRHGCPRSRRSPG